MHLPETNNSNEPTKEQQRAASIIQKQFFKHRSKKAYQALKDYYDIDINQQSKINFQKLIKELKNISWMPEEQKKLYKNRDPYNYLITEEQLLLHFCLKEIVPDITLKHGLQDADEFTALKSIGQRQQNNQTINNNNTGGFIRHNNFFVAGVGLHHETPRFLGSLRDEIVIRLGAMSEQEKTRFSELWISGHLTDFLKSNAYHPISFNGTKRQLKFDAKDMTKTFTYTRNDLDKPLVRTLHFKDEIYKAGDNLTTLYRAIFLQFILELRYLGPDFQQYFWKKSRNKQFVINVFHILFQSVIYPEAKLPVSVPLDKPYIIKLQHTKTFFQNFRRIAQTIKAGDSDELIQCLKDGIPVNIQQQETGDTPLILALKNDRLTLADILLAHGADPLMCNKFGNSAFITAIENRQIEFLKKLLTANSPQKIPKIKYHIDLELNEKFTHEIVKASCISPKADEILDLLLLNGLKISPNLPIVIWLYQAKKIALMKMFIEKHHANIAVTNKGKSVLMLAVERNDEDTATYFIKLGININFQVTTTDQFIPKEEGWTALHFAANSGHIKMVNLLLSNNIDPHITSWHGDTAADITTEMVAEDLPSFIKRNGYDSQIRGYLSASFMMYQGDVAKTMATKMMEDSRNRYQIQFSQEKTQFILVKEIFDQRQLTKPLPNKTPLQKCTSRKFSCAAVVTGIIKGQHHVILIRKANQQGQAHGFYMVPGGLKDDKDSSYIEAIKREIFEEIGIVVTDDLQTNEIHSFDHINGKEQRFVCHKFFHIQLGNKLEHLKIFARDDAVEAINVKWSDVQRSTEGYFINGIRIQHSNAVIIDKLLLNQTLHPQSINDQLEFEYYSGYDELYTALRANDIDSIHTICRKGLDLTDFNCIHIACKAGKTIEKSKEMIETLLHYQANIDHPMRLTVGSNFEFHTPLTNMIHAGLFDLAKYLITLGADINLMIKNTSPLIAACRVGNRAFVQFLLQSGATLDQNLGGCALLTAMTFNHFEIAQDLLSYNKINLNKPYSFGGISFVTSNETNLLFIAIRRRLPNFVKLLLDANASVFITEDGTTTALEFVRKMQERNNEKIESKRQMLDYMNQPVKPASDLLEFNSVLFGNVNNDQMAKLTLDQLDQDIIKPEIVEEIVKLMEAAAEKELAHQTVKQKLL